MKQIMPKPLTLIDLLAGLVALWVCVAVVARGTPAFAAHTNERADPSVWIDPKPEVSPCAFNLEEAMRQIERWVPDPETFTYRDGAHQLLFIMQPDTYQRFVDDRHFFELIKAQCWRREE